jgi:hypothetical protein
MIEIQKFLLHSQVEFHCVMLHSVCGSKAGANKERCRSISFLCSEKRGLREKDTRRMRCSTNGI